MNLLRKISWWIEEWGPLRVAVVVAAFGGLAVAVVMLTNAFSEYRKQRMSMINAMGEVMLLTEQVENERSKLGPEFLTSVENQFEHAQQHLFADIEEVNRWLARVRELAKEQQLNCAAQPLEPREGIVFTNWVRLLPVKLSFHYFGGEGSGYFPFLRFLKQLQLSNEKKWTVEQLELEVLTNGPTRASVLLLLWCRREMLP